MALSRLSKIPKFITPARCFASRDFSTALRPLDEVPAEERRKYAYQYADQLFGSNQTERIYSDKWYGNPKGILDHVGGPLPLAAFITLSAVSKELLIVSPEFIHWGVWSTWLTLVYGAMKGKVNDHFLEKKRQRIKDWDVTSDIYIETLKAIRKNYEFYIQTHFLFKDLLEHASPSVEIANHAKQRNIQLAAHQAVLSTLTKIREDEKARESVAAAAVAAGMKDWIIQAWAEVPESVKDEALDSRIASLADPQGLITDPISTLVELYFELKPWEQQSEEVQE